VVAPRLSDWRLAQPGRDIAARKAHVELIEEITGQTTQLAVKAGVALQNIYEAVFSETQPCCTSPRRTDPTRSVSIPTPLR